MAPTLVAAHVVRIIKTDSDKCHHTGTECLDDSIDILGLNAVDDVVAASGYEMTALHDLHSGLAQSQHKSIIVYSRGAILQSPGTLPPTHQICREGRTHLFLGNEVSRDERQ